jgi:hypothetical protein
VTCLVIRLKKYRKAKVALSLAATFCFWRICLREEGSIFGLEKKHPEFQMLERWVRKNNSRVPI